ncbi:MAG: 4-vinyl reductase [Deltaproteobacteria bacterium]|jgi:predicted hydrocarbon binding protein|nr:4-vinyl reductase [Deltaproteobacteria bacterium]MBW2481486.1 4-vinyl reductase [Deltaproteobacteria bacterium]
MMETFSELINRLNLTAENRLELDEVPMVLMPLWFFVGIMKRIGAEVGSGRAAEIYYDAGYEGAYKWSKVQIENGLKGPAVLEQYLNSMTNRGWGRFEILSLEEKDGRALFRLHHSAIALEQGLSEAPSCHWVPGAMAGSLQAILESKGNPLKVIGKEIGCLSAGQPYCEIIVEPATR